MTSVTRRRLTSDSPCSTTWTRISAACTQAAGSLRPGSQPRHPAVRGLAEVVTDCAIPVQPFRDLIAANRQDQIVTRYETFDDLLGYCTLSANPVGRIVLTCSAAARQAGQSCPTRSAAGSRSSSTCRTLPRTCGQAASTCQPPTCISYGCTEQDLAGASGAAAAAQADRIRGRPRRGADQLRLAARRAAPGLGPDRRVGLHRRRPGRARRDHAGWL